MIAIAPMLNKHSTDAIANADELLDTSGQRRKVGVIADGAIVKNVIIAVAVPPAAMLTDDVELQLAPEGKPEQTGSIGTIPLLVKSFCEVKVSVVDPDCPGDKIVTVVGLAVTE